MTDTMTLEQVLLDMADCQGNRGVGHTYSRLTSWRLAIDAAIKRREQDKRDAARYRWLRDNPEHPSVPYFSDGRWYIAYEVSNAGGFGGGVGAMSFDTLDAAIDVAMKEGATRAC